MCVRVPRKSDDASKRVPSVPGARPAEPQPSPTCPAARLSGAWLCAGPRGGMRGWRGRGGPAGSEAGPRGASARWGQVRDDQVPPLGVRGGSFPSWQSVLLVLGQPLHWFSRLLPCAPPACLAPPDRPSPSRPSTGVARAFCSHLPQGLRFTENCRLPPWVPVWDLVYEAAAVTSTSLSGCTEGLELPAHPVLCPAALCVASVLL